MRRLALPRNGLDLHLGLDVLFGGLISLRLLESAGRHHPVEHVLLARTGQVVMDQRIVGGRCLNQPGEESGLRGREVFGVLCEVGARCGPDSIGPVTVIDAIQVHSQDLVLRKALFERDRKDHLMHFAATDFSGVRSWIFTSCWVMVLPPSFKPRWVTSTHRARAVDPASIAPWWEKLRSSAASV